LFFVHNGFRLFVAQASNVPDQRPGATDLRLSTGAPSPGSLNQALIALEEDKVIQAALGAHTCERFISAKRLECEEYRLIVTDWELGKYLPNY